MAARTGFSAQTMSVLAALCAEPARWQHGYALARRTGLKSGTLYPILIRLSDRGLLEACWQDEPKPGRPRRHLYRLTDAGLASARAAQADEAGRIPAPAGRPRPVPAAGERARPGGRGAVPSVP